jgi:thioester reductase-like protein
VSSSPYAPPRAGPRELATDGEAGLWYIDQSAQYPDVYNAPFVLDFSARLDRDALRSALATVIARHESLRLVFQPGVGGLYTAVRTESTVDLAHYVTGPTGTSAEIVRRLAGEPFDLSTGPLLRAAVITGPGGREVLFVNAHHIVMDASSAMITVRELRTAYRNARNGQPGIRGPVTWWSRQEYRSWLDAKHKVQRDVDSASYWSARLGDAPRVIRMRTDHLRPAVQGLHGGSVNAVLPPALTASVSSFARAQRLTPFMVYLLAFALLLREQGAGDDIVIGTPISLRDHPRLRDMVGYIANMVCVRMEVPGGTTHRKLLADTKQELLGSLRHKEFGFNRVIDTLRPKRDSSHAPVFQVAISMAPRELSSLNGATPGAAEPDVLGWQHITHGAKYDLLLIIEQGRDRTGVTLEFDAALFRERTARTMLSRFAELVGIVVSAPEQRLPEIGNAAGPDVAAAEPAGGRRAARGQADGEATRQVRDIWLELLGLDEVHDDEDFFSAGGYSLLAAKLASLVRQRLGVEVTLGALLRDPTVHGMAAVVTAIRRARGGVDPPSPQTPEDGPARRRVEDDMAADATRWAAALALRQPPGSLVSPATAVLVTGATGLLGSHLVGELLRRSPVTVYCQVRASDTAEAANRLDAAMRRFRVEVADPRRLRCVAGDVTQDRLGLAPDDWNRACAEVDAVYHMAAQFNFAASYASLRRVNVDGFGNVALFCTEGRPRMLHYASSAAAFSPADGHATVSERDVPRNRYGLQIGYAQTKWVNEQIAARARAVGTPLCLFRIGRICGASDTGACRPDDFFWLQLRAILESGSAPDPLWPPVDLLPADYVARAVTELGSFAPAAGGTFHIALPRPVTWDRMLAFAIAAGYRIKRVPLETWLSDLADREDERGLALAAITELLRGAARGTRLAALATDATARALRDLDVPFPQFDDSWLTAMTRYFSETGYFRSGARGFSAERDKRTREGTVR